MGSYIFNINKDESNQIESKICLKNIKNINILKKVLNHLEKIKLFLIINYNKYFQKKLNIKFNEYKEYSEIYSNIEIEIIPVQNKNGKFINYLTKEDKKYIKIYFNTNTKAIKRNYLTMNDKITKIKILLDHHIKTFNNLFSRCESIESFNFKKFSSNNIDDMSHMFFRCSSLKKIDLSNYRNENATYMSYMFYGCTSLEELNLSNLKTNKTERMFVDCFSLKKINFSNFNTDKLKYTEKMFFNCSSLEELDLSSFNTNNFIDIKQMFYGCSSLKLLVLSNFTPERLSKIKKMFNGLIIIKN